MLTRTSVVPCRLRFLGFPGRKQSIHQASGSPFPLSEASPFRCLAPLPSNPGAEKVSPENVIRTSYHRAIHLSVQFQSVTSISFHVDNRINSYTGQNIRLSTLFTTARCFSGIACKSYSYLFTDAGVKNCTATLRPIGNDSGLPSRPSRAPGISRALSSE